MPKTSHPSSNSLFYSPLFGARFLSPHPLLLLPSFVDRQDPEQINQGVKNRAVHLIWKREISTAERAWLYDLCEEGEVDCAKSWLYADCALSDVYGLCPANAAGRTWDRLARCSGLRKAFDSDGRDVDDQCLILAQQQGPHTFFPIERRHLLLKSLWVQASEDLKEAGVTNITKDQHLAWPPCSQLLEIWLAACRQRADESRSEIGLDSAVSAHLLLSPWNPFEAPL